MWNPTHIQVIVLRAKGLLTKGKNGTNNCFATIEVGKEKYATSIKESALPVLEWHEECELTIPDKGNRAELVVKCLHRNNFSVDEFLGQVTLPLSDMDVYEKPRSKWYKLQSKPGKDKKDKDRGELEIRIAFTVKSGSLMDLSKKEKKGSTLGSSLGLGGGGGSLLSINTLEKKKKLKDFAKSLGSKVHLTGKPKKDKQNADNGSNSGSISSIGTPGSGVFAPRRFGQSAGDADPGVISEDEDEFVFDKLSHKSSGSSLNVAKVPSNSHQTPPSPLASNSSKSENEDIRLRSKTLPPSKPPRINGDSGTQKVDEWEAKLYGKHLEVGSSDSLKRRSWESSRVMLSSQQDIHESTKEPAGEHALANTAPTTPNLEDQKRTTSEQVDKPRPLPRSATLESIVEKEKETKEEVVEKKPEKRLSKFKYFRKEKTDSLEDIKHKLGNKQFGERIIIGHENDLKRHGAEVPQELLKKYDGKSREEIILFANDLENEVRIQKMKMKEMEDYLDNLLLRVMETQPKLLQNPYRSHNSTKSG